jgi:DCN1-like protein 1/2
MTIHTLCPSLSEDNQDIIGIDGTMQFCQDLGLEPTQIEFLVLSHHLGSERMAEFTQSGFVEGWLKLRCDSIDKMKNAISTFRQWMEDDEAHFKEVYLYAFKFGRQAGQKSLCK